MTSGFGSITFTKYRSKFRALLLQKIGIYAKNQHFARFFGNFAQNRDFTPTLFSLEKRVFNIFP